MLPPTLRLLQLPLVLIIEIALKRSMQHDRPILLFALLNDLASHLTLNLAGGLE